MMQRNVQEQRKQGEEDGMLVAEGYSGPTMPVKELLEIPGVALELSKERQLRELFPGVRSSKS